MLRGLRSREEPLTQQQQQQPPAQPTQPQQAAATAIETLVLAADGEGGAASTRLRTALARAPPHAVGRGGADGLLQRVRGQQALRCLHPCGRYLLAERQAGAEAPTGA